MKINCQSNNEAETISQATPEKLGVLIIPTNFK